jgi:tRNA A37 threonylcarbamoyladenosine dehydratase
MEFPPEKLEPSDAARRFSGMDRLLGVEPARQFRNSHVAVVGIGGVGSWAAEALARSGVSRMSLFDLDHVAESNINRQLHALTDTIGMAKVDAMRARIHGINPDCLVRSVDEFVTAENWPGILSEEVDAVIDCCDDVRAKVAMAAWARNTQKVFLSVGAAGGKRLAHLVDIADLSQCTHDPLLSQMRYRLRKEHGAPKEGKRMQIACVYSKEAVRGPDASCAVDGDGSLNCHGYGSMVSVTATFGMCAAGWIVDKLSAYSKSTEQKTL